MVTSTFTGKGYTTTMDYITGDSSRIIISNNPDTPLVFNFDLFEFEIKDIIGLSKIKFKMSFKHLMDFIILALNCIDYAESQIMNIPSEIPYESLSIVFDYIEDTNIHFIIYRSTIYQSIVVVDIVFIEDTLCDFINTIINDYLEKNHKIELIQYMHKEGIIWN